MGDEFRPGVERARQMGYPIEAKPYDTGPEGIEESIQKTCLKIREGRLDPDVRGWAGDVLIAAGRPETVRGKVQAIVEAFRRETMYNPDPVGAEYIVAAAATVCLRPGLCVRARDCDDGDVMCGAALMSIGIPVVVVKQYFGPKAQQHVLLEAELEDGGWCPFDPSTDMPVGQKPKAVSEERYDPMDQVSPTTGTSGAEIVTLGAPPRGAPRNLHRIGRYWFEVRYGRLFMHNGRRWVLWTIDTEEPIVGWPRIEEIVTRRMRALGLGDPSQLGLPPGAWAPNPSFLITAGLRYLTIVVVPGAWTADDVTVALKDFFFIEAVIPRGTGMYASWLVQGVARQTMQLVSTADMNMAASFVEAPSPDPSKPPTPPAPKPAEAQPESTMSSGAVFGTALVLTGALAAAGFAIYHYRAPIKKALAKRASR